MSQVSASDLKALYAKNPDDLTLDEVRTLQADVQKFYNDYGIYDTHYKERGNDFFRTILITADEGIVINSENENAIPSGELFKDYLVGAFKTAVSTKATEVAAFERVLAEKLIALTNGT